MTKILRLGRAGSLLAALLLAAPSVLHAQTTSSVARPAWPQEASSFDQLQMLVRPNEMVTVRDASGAEARGRIVGLSTASLQLVVNGTPRSFTMPDVVEVRTRRPDSVGNGAKVGTIVGAVFGGIGAIIVCASEDCEAWLWGTVAAYTVMGTGAGVAIDALIVHEKTLFRRSGGTAVSRLQIGPVLDRQRKGIAVRFAF